jgi:hypothetical protein
MNKQKLITYEDKLDYLVELVENGKKIDWDYAVKRLGLNINPDSLRKAFNTTEFSGYNVYKEMLKRREENLDTDEIQKLEELQNAIFKERVKLQTANIEKSRVLRQESRCEMFYEQIKHCIKHIDPPKLQRSHVRCCKHNKKYIQVLTDIHYNSTFKSVNNEYNPQIVKDRFAVLLQETINFIQQRNLKEFNVLGLQDFIQGMIHITDLQINHSSVVKSVVEISHIIADYLNELSAYADITYIDCLYSNHAEIRPLGTKANQLMDEDLGYIIGNYIKDLLENNNNVNIILSNDGDTFIEIPNIYNFNIIAGHGHQIKDIEKAISDLSIQRRKLYDCVILGHRHASSEIVVGESYNNDIEVLTASSFIGSDPYSDSLYKGSKGAVNIYGFDEKYGHTETYKMILN